MATKRFKKLPKDSQRAAFAQMDEDGTRQGRGGKGGGGVVRAPRTLDPDTPQQNARKKELKKAFKVVVAGGETGRRLNTDSAKNKAAANALAVFASKEGAASAKFSKGVEARALAQKAKTGKTNKAFLRKYFDL